MAEKPANILWLSLGLALVGGYADAASFLLAQTFTGHLTGNFVLMAISLASREWPTFFRRALAIAFFLMGIILSVALEQWLAKKPSRTILPAVPLVESALILAAYGALAAPLATHLELFTVCMALALGLQNGAWRQAGGITVHSTYLTGMVTSLLTTGTKKYFFKAAGEPDAGLKISLLLGIWITFFVGAALGAALVLLCGGIAILGAALALIALLIGQSMLPARQATGGHTDKNPPPGD